MSEEFDSYGLRIRLIADYEYDDGRKVGQFKQTVLEPGLDDVLESVLQMIEGCYSWGISRLELIERCKNELDLLGLEFKPGRYKKPDEFAELDADDPMAERNNDILDRIREAKRGPLENYVGHVLDDAAAEIERLRSRQTCGGDKPYVCHELATARSELKAATKELDEASPMTRCDCCGCSFRLHKMVIEEGDRWECYPCWEALNEKERSK